MQPPTEPSSLVCDPPRASFTPVVHSLPKLSFRFCDRVYGFISDVWDLPRPAWLIPGWLQSSRQVPSLLGQSFNQRLTITRLPYAALLQSQSQVMSHAELLPQTERMLWKTGLCGDGQWWCFRTAKAHSPLSDLAVRNATGSWTMFWALKTNTKLRLGPFFKTTWNIMYQSNWKLSWGKTFCFFAKQIHCSLTGKSSQEHFSVRDSCLNLSHFMNVLSRWKMSPRNQLRKFRNMGIG